jgi:hypothetical protein
VKVAAFASKYREMNASDIIITFYLFLFFGGTWVLSQAFTLAKQVLCHLSHFASPDLNLCFLLKLFTVCYLFTKKKKKERKKEKKKKS